MLGVGNVRSGLCRVWDGEWGCGYHGVVFVSKVSVVQVVGGGFGLGKGVVSTTPIVLPRLSCCHASRVATTLVLPR